MKKKSKQNLAISIIAGVIIITVIGYYYTSDQARIRGYTFGNELQQIQEDLKKLQVDFDTQIGMWHDKSITKDDFLRYSKDHITDMEELYKRYNDLLVPVPFVSSVELFKLSTDAQIKSDNELILWIETNDTSHKIRSDQLLQDAFDYEASALGKFNEAKK